MKKAASLFLTLSAASLLASQTGLAGAQAKPDRRALLIDVTSFSEFKKIEPLGFSADPQVDIPVLSRALKAKGFTVTALKDSEASHKQVMAALDEIAATAKPDDTILLYFSGHGAKAHGQFNLCPWDAQAESPINDVKESDLKEWLTKLKARNVTLVLDCCFNDMEIKNRPLKPLFRAKTIGRHNIGPDTQGEQVNIAPERAVILSATSPDGTALHVMPFVRPKWIGLFTMKLVQEMDVASPQTTYRSLMADVQADVQKWIDVSKPTLKGAAITQTPTLYGAASLVDRPLFAPVPESAPAPQGGEAKPAPPVVALPVVAPAAKPTAIVQQAASGKLVINSDKADGLTEGSKVELKDKQGKVIGSGQIGKITQGSADVIPDKGVTPNLLLPDVSVTVTKIKNDVTRDGEFSMFLEGGSEFTVPVQKSLERFPFLKVVTDRAQARMILKGTGGPSGFTGKLVAPDGETSLTPNDTPVQGKDASEFVEKFSADLMQLATLTAINRLQNPTRSFSVTVQSDKPQYIEGDLATFKCAANQNCYVFLYVTDDTGYPGLLWPLKDTDKNYLKIGDTLNLPPQPQPQRTLTYPVMPPYGTVKVSVLAILDKAEAEKIKKGLLTGQNLNRMHTAGSGHGIGAFQDVQDLQLGSPEHWMINSLTVTTLSNKEAGRP